MHESYVFRPKKVSIYLTPVFHLLLILFLSFVAQLEAQAEYSCKDIFTSQTNGAAFLKQQEPNLHTTPMVERLIKKVQSRYKSPIVKPLDRITAWIKYLESMYSFLQQHPTSQLKIKNIFYNQYIIKPQDVPQSYFDLQVRIAREQGRGNISLTPEIKRQYTEAIITDQKRTLDIWLDYFMSKDTQMYPMWVKHWILNGMVRLSRFQNETFTFEKRGPDTVAPFVELNREAIAYIVDMIVKKANGDSLADIQDPNIRNLLASAHFGKLYGQAIKSAASVQAPLHITEGVWIKYPMKSDSKQLVDSLQGKNTGWCTAGEYTARKQIQSGDFYVYYSKDLQGQPTVPRIAIRMNGTAEIAEVRGRAQQQHLDSDIAGTNILSAKLEEFGHQGKLYQKRTIHMKKLTQIENKHKKNEDLTAEDLRFLYEIDGDIRGFGYQKDPRIDEIINARNNIRNDLMLVFNCRPEQISFTTQEALSGDVLYHRGFLYLESVKLPHGLALPQHVSGTVSLGTNVTSAEGLILPRYVGGSLFLSVTSAKGLILPKHVGEDLYLESLTSAQGLVLPEHIGQYLYLPSLKSTAGLILPKQSAGIDLSGLTSAKGLVLPETLGELNLSGLTSARGLVLPSSLPLNKLNVSADVRAQLEK